jgi:hypothetical protein
MRVPRTESPKFLPNGFSGTLRGSRAATARVDCGVPFVDWGGGSMRLRWLVSACVLMTPLVVSTTATAKPRLPPRQEACEAFAKSGRTPDSVWEPLLLLSAAGYEQSDSLTQHYAEDPAGSASRIGAWCRSHYRHDKVLRRATFVPSPNDPTMTTEEYNQITQGMSLPEIQIIVGSLGQVGPPCPASPLPDLAGPDGKLVPCYWWPGPTPDSYGGVYMGDGKMVNKYGIKI